MLKRSLEKLFRAVNRAQRVLILPHNNPDPDSIASAAALRYLLTEKWNFEGDIAYKGIIGRAENRALVYYLGQPFRALTDSDFDHSPTVVLIDTQPSQGNNPVSPEIAIAVVIDHHEFSGASSGAKVTFADIQPKLGATSTILTGYLREADLAPPAPLATALFYGIKTNTLGLGRNTDPADASAYHYLQPRIDVEALAKIENARVPAHYFKSYDLALRSAHIYNGVVVSHIGALSYPDLVAEMADLLLRLEESQCVICIGVYADSLILSVRTLGRHGKAEQLIRAIIGADGMAGGHGTIAGGQIPLAGRTPESIASQLIPKILHYFSMPPDTIGKPLI